MDTHQNIGPRLMEVFSGIAGFVKMSNLNSNSNINQHMEAYITDLFNILYENHNFTHLDPIKFNSKGIDIISQDGSIGIQVTSDFSKEKVEETIVKVTSLDPPIKTLMMVYPSELKPKRKKIIVPKKFTLEEWSFNEIIREARKSGKKRIAEVYELSLKYFPEITTTQNTLREIENLHYSIFITNIKKPSIYISRRISIYGKENFHDDDSSLNNLDPINLWTHIVGKKRVILIADPGIGKTIELVNFSHMLSENELAYPLFKYLKEYDPNEKFENFLPQNWMLVPDNKKILILDGFDEVKIADSEIVIKKINRYSDKNPRVKILITCRRSFYATVLDGNLKNFSLCYLHKFNLKNIQEYVELRFGIDGLNFIDRCHLLDILDLAENPYYLELLGREFRQNNGIHGSRSEILKVIFNKRIKYDLKEHFLPSIPDAVSREDVENALQKIAFILTMRGSTQIMHYDLQKIIKEHHLISNLKQLLVFNQNSNGLSSSWSFEHNHLRDFLTAKHLSRLEFKDLKKLVCFPNTTHILPNWYDAITLLLNIEDQASDLFSTLRDLLLANEFETLIMVERDKINPTIRFEILRRLIEYYKVRTIWLRLKGVEENRLAYFVQSNESFEYLLSEIKNPKGPRRHRLNCLFILKEFKNLNYEQKEKIKEVFFPILELHQKDSHLSQYFIESIAELEIIDPETTEFLEKMYKHRSNQFIRGAMYLYISKISTPDIWVNYLLDGMIVEKKTDSDRESVQNGSEGINLVSAFKNIRCENSIIKILNAFFENSRYENWYYFAEILESILCRAAECPSPSKQLFDLIYSLNSKLNTPWSHPYHNLFLEYFEKSNLIQLGLSTAIKLTKKKLNLTEAGEIATFLNEKTLYLIEPFLQSGEISFEAAETIYYALKFYDNKFCELFRTRIADLTGKTIPTEKPINSRNNQREFVRKKLNPWFQAQTLKKEIVGILDKIGDLDAENLSHSIFEGDLRDKESLSLHHKAKEILREISLDTRWTKANIIEWANNQVDFEIFLVGKICEILYHHNPIDHLTEKQIYFLKSWFDRNVNRVNFESIRILGSHANDDDLVLVKHLTYLLETFEFACPEEKLLEMLAFCNDTSDSFKTLTISTIISRVGKEKVEERIINNILSNRIQNTLALRSHFKYAFENSMTDLFDRIFQLMTKSTFEITCHLSELGQFFSSNNNPNYLFPYFDNFNEQDQIYILDNLQETYFNAELDKFIVSIENQVFSKELSRSLNSLLLRQGKTEGLKKSIHWIKTYKSNPFHHKHVELVNFNSLEVLPDLIELLVLSYDNEIHNNNRIDTLWGKARTGLIELARKSDAFAEVIIFQLEKLIIENPFQIDDIAYNYEIIEDIKEIVKKKQLNPTPLSTKKCIEIYEEIFG